MDSSVKFQEILDLECLTPTVLHDYISVVFYGDRHGKYYDLSGNKSLHLASSMSYVKRNDFEDFPDTMAAAAHWDVRWMFY